MNFKKRVTAKKRKKVGGFKKGKKEDGFKIEEQMEGFKKRGRASKKEVRLYRQKRDDFIKEKKE